MVDRDEMLSASNNISYILVDVLSDWIVREGNNLESFINYPTEHVDYSPYMIPDFNALNVRLSELRQIEPAFTVISGYKQGLEGYTESMYENAIDSLPVIFLQRLYDWAIKRRAEMEAVINGTGVNSTAPISDYNGMYTFDTAKYTSEYQMYVDATNALEIIIEYKNENP